MNREHTSWIVTGVSDKINGNVHRANFLSQFFPHPIHVFACFYRDLRIADPMCRISKGPLQLG